MRTHLKLPRSLALQMQADLHRPHGFAQERVGFLAAGASLFGEGNLLLIARYYSPVGDSDYERDPSCGARIGGTAFRKALEVAYRTRSTLIHIHSHGGLGIPRFSGIDLRSGGEFVPGFFEAIPSMPHGMVVLSNNRAAGLVWLNRRAAPLEIASFGIIGAPMTKFGVPK